MTTPPLPTSMRAWTYKTTTPTLEANLTLTTQPTPTPLPTHHLIRTLAASLNPVDHKPSETPLLGRLLVPKPATPGFDISGRIVIPASNSPFEPGQLVYGAASSNPLTGGALAEYVAVPAQTVRAVPEGVSPIEAAGVPVAAITAYGSLVPYIRPGTRVFINGGSGGVGTFGIQIAKAAGAHVTVSCSAKNAELCLELGADEVLDYTAAPLLTQLRAIAAAGRPFEHVVDNVFSDPALYFRAHEYSTPTAAFVEVASAPSLAFLRFAVGGFLWPGFLGGGKRRLVIFADGVTGEGLERVGKLIEEGKVRTVVDRVFGMEEVPEAYGRLKTGRARGKIVVRVAGEDL